MQTKSLGAHFKDEFQLNACKLLPNSSFNLSAKILVMFFISFHYFHTFYARVQNWIARMSSSLHFFFCRRNPAVKMSKKFLNPITRCSRCRLAAERSLIATTQIFSQTTTFGAIPLSSNPLLMAPSWYFSIALWNRLIKFFVSCCFLRRILGFCLSCRLFLHHLQHPVLRHFELLGYCAAAQFINI